MPGLPQQEDSFPAHEPPAPRKAPPLTEQKPAGHWLARRWSDPTAASKPCLVLVLVLALVVPRARPGPLLAFWYGRKVQQKVPSSGFPFPLSLLLLLLPPLRPAVSPPTDLAPAAAVATQPYLPYLPFLLFAFCLPRLPFLDGSFFDASSAASTITSTPTTAPNVNTLLLIRIPLPASLLFDSSTTFRKLQSHFVGLVVSSFEAVAPLLGANHLGTRVLRQEGNWAGRNQKKEIDNAPLD
ncbi:hypothetical protein CEP52_001797 [Fusarium oligoseptatum]|uniref:Uncharacterized protein n=1 Tax=Fusarium oligoseptatum TaxID=2604345 RepID=A0A428UHD9_9HYPO|nr:hypothetical protein CEP52_001797 [Fusarium oligoseptatum]